VAVFFNGIDQPRDASLETRCGARRSIRRPPRLPLPAPSLPRCWCAARPLAAARAGPPPQPPSGF